MQTQTHQQYLLTGSATTPSTLWDSASSAVGNFDDFTHVTTLVTLIDGTPVLSDTRTVAQFKEAYESGLV